MPRKKKLLVIVAGFAALIAAFLFAFSLISTSHSISKAEIARSTAVAKAVGQVTGVLLISSRQKLVPGGTSCTNNTYLVVGDAGWAVVTSELFMRARQPDWSVDRLSLGWVSGSGYC